MIYFSIFWMIWACTIDLNSGGSYNSVDHSEKIKDFNENNEKSPKILPKVAAEAVNVCITEVYVDGTSIEWIEIYNPTGSPVTLTGWDIYDGGGANIEVDIGSLVSSIAAGEVITFGDAAASPDYTYTVSFVDTGEELILRDNLGQYQDVVLYGTVGAGYLNTWFWQSSYSVTTPDAVGHSIERINLTLGGELEDNNVRSDWRYCISPTQGSLRSWPGQLSLNVSITEVFADSTDAEWIEIYNPTGSAVTLTGWDIYDLGGANIEVDIGSLVSSIAAGEIITFGDSGASPDYVVSGGVTFTDTGEELVLRDNLGQYQDAVLYGSDAAGYLNTWYWQSSNTVEAPNGPGESIERINVSGVVGGNLLDSNHHFDWNLTYIQTPGSLPQSPIIDTSPPTYSDLTEITDPLELGDTVIIRINVTDPSGINQVKIEFEGSNHSMTNIYSNTWQYDSWTPFSKGINDYTIYMEDNSDNWNSTSDSIEVIKTMPFSYFEFNKKITIDNTKVNGSGNHTNFPLYLSLYDLDLRYEAQPDGDDIAFSDGTKWLDHEIELFNQTYNETHAQLIAWVRIPSLSPSIDTNITMYFGNLTIGPLENPSGVWDPYYKGVWHLNKTFLDSTINNNDGTNSQSVDVNGFLAGARDFDGVDDNINVSSGSSIDNIFNGGATISTWIFPEGWGGAQYGRILDKSTTTLGADGWGMCVDGEADAVYHHLLFYRDFDSNRGVWYTPEDSISLDQWYHIAVTYDDTSTSINPIIYLNGVLQSITEDEAPVGSASDDSAQSLFFGDFMGGGRAFNGTIDEIRLSNIDRSADWIATEFNNQDDPNSFYSVEEINPMPMPISYFKLNKTISIDHTKVNGSSNHNNFPLFLSFYDVNLRSEVQPDGDDIAFSDGYRWLDHEIELFNQTYNGTHAQLIAWVRIPSLSPSIDTNITMYFGNSTMGPQENPSCVWGPYYKGVWHLNEDPADPPPQFQDSTLYYNNGTAYNLTSAHQVEGKIDGSLVFDDTMGRCVNVSHHSSLQLTTDITISAWVKTTNSDGNANLIITKWGSSSPNQNYWLGKLDGSNIAFFVDSTQSVQANLNLINDGDWHYVVGVADANNNLLRIFIDGIQRNTNAYTGTSETGTSVLNIGRSAGEINQEWDGGIDEARVSNIDRSADWIATEFNNQDDPNSFYSIEIIDYTPPSYSNLTESADPLELGNTEIITINATDSSGINQVLIEYDLTNHSMTYIGGIMWQYNNWTPSSIGNFPYTIWIEDNYNNWNSTNDSIDVVDNTPPSYSNLTESADPLELYYTEIITINVTDAAGINQVLIEIGGVNYSMINIVGDLWQNNSWTPSSTGNYLYTIWMEDNNNNWNSTSDSIDVTPDITPPSYSNLTESADPLELNYTEVISINVTDLAGINQVLIEYDLTNHSMTYIGGIMWQYNNWTPPSTGNYPYTIWMEDNNNNWNSTSDSIDVTPHITPPSYSNLTESADPLELGNTEIISINVTDVAGINQVLIEIGGVNYSMINIVGDLWRNNSWIPLSTGNYPYTIWMEDNYNNWNSTSGSIQVVDTTLPSYSNLTESADPLELGETEIISINITDLSGINQVLIEIESVNYSMINIIGDLWRNDSWTPNSTGLYLYTIWIEDNNNNWNSTSDSIQVEDTINPTYSNLIESADPLELGSVEIISINATDISGINQVLIDFGTGNQSMTNIGGTGWRYDSWNPSFTGIYPYTLWIEDNNNNWNSTSDSIQVEDTINPAYSNLLESADPLELGDTETIWITVTDISLINQVLIDYGTGNQSMNDIGGNIWRYDSWIPTSTGSNKVYVIYMEDNNNNWNTTIGSIQVIDTVNPFYSNMVESADPLELGDIEVISINATDVSGINQVLIDFGTGNQTMTNIGGTGWQYDTWTPLSTGNYPYTIWMEDNNNNWNSTSDSIQVEDTINPAYSNLNESADPLELYFTEIISINVTDISGINQVLIDFGTGNQSMTNIGGTGWQYDTWTPLSTGNYPYTIWIEDNNNNWNSTSDSIDVTPDVTAPTFVNLIESADPLQLGQNETITISVFDNPGSGVNQVLLEYNSINHTMNFIGGDTWRWRNWKPASEEVYNYSIYMEDNVGNWNFTIGNFTVISTDAPIIENLTFSENPLELGNNITIFVDVYDNETYVSIVLIELENVNYTMTNYTFFTFEFNWTRNSTGIVIFTIYANDTGNNWNKYTDSFNIIDTTAPSFLNLTESQDPLELGDTEIITINVTDLGGINQVKIEFEGANHSMANIVGNMWQSDSWAPLSTGNYPYTIWMEDNSNNWNSTSDSIQVIDTINPTYSDLIESADPVELGTTLIITINAIDLSGINQVKIEFEGANHSMTNIGGGIWQYDTWMPTATSNYTYTIHIEDNNNNWNSTSDWIIFQDTISPSYSNLIEGAQSGGSVDPLELGDTLIITIVITDFAGINQSLIEYEGSNHSMMFIGGNLWFYSSWTPINRGNNTYKIYMEDNSGNWNFTSDWVMVEDTTPPSEPIITNAPSGEVSGLFTFDWKEGNDPSGIDYYLLIISTKADINNTAAYVLEINTTNTYYKLTKALPLGTYYYFLYQVDNVGLKSSSTKGTFKVISPGVTSEDNFIIIIIIAVISAVAVGSAAVIIIVKRKSQVLLPPRKKIPFKTIYSHIEKISRSQQLIEKDKFVKKVKVEKIEKIPPLQLESMDNLELEQKLDEIQTFGEELFAEGAYFEALKQYELTEKILQRLERQSESQIYTDLIKEIDFLIEARDMKLNVLEQAKTSDDFMRIFNVYYDIIEISKRLSDYDTIDIYQSELIELFHERKMNIAELELKKTILDEMATSVLNENDFEKAARMYKQCERFSHFLFQIGKEDELANMKKFRNKKNECIKKISK